MSESLKVDSSSTGCLLVTGSAVTSIAIGYLCGEPFGWLTFGVICLACAAINMMFQAVVVRSVLRNRTKS